VKEESKRMQQQALKINGELVAGLRDQLQNPADVASVLKEVKRMLMIKQRIALEAEVGC